MLNQDNCIIGGNCLDIMPLIADKSIDMILCDLPYGKTRNVWDKPIDMSSLWAEYRRIIKDNGAIILTAIQPFTTDLINSARDIFRYDLVWEKSMPVGYLNANRMPLRSHESILVFYKKLPTFNPQKINGQGPKKVMGKKDNRCKSYGKHSKIDYNGDSGVRYPKSIVRFINGNNHTGHPTAKPIALFEWLIASYSNPGELVLDIVWDLAQPR